MDLSMLTKGLKESAVGQFGQWLVGKLGIENEGVLDTFHVDREAKIFDVTVKRKDHPEPMDLKIQYTLESRDGKDFLILTPMEGSEEWLNKALQGESAAQYFNRPIELPALVAAAAKHFL
jgi:hypothetical protein